MNEKATITAKLKLDQERLNAAMGPLREMTETLKKASSLADELALRLKELRVEIDFRSVKG